jgi:predicted secreted protein
MKVLLLIVVAFCYTQDNNFRTVKLEDITPDSYIPVKIGQRVLIEAEGNSTTGFVWILSNTQHLEKVKALNLDEKNSGEFYSRDGILGAKEIYHFKFESIEAGNDVLIFKYQRPGDKDKPKTTKSINIIVVHPDPNSDL